MPRPIETWVRDIERSQRRVDRQRQEQPQRWRPRASDYVAFPAFVVLVCLFVLIGGLIVVRVVIA